MEKEEDTHRETEIKTFYLLSHSPHGHKDLSRTMPRPACIDFIRPSVWEAGTQGLVLSSAFPRTSVGNWTGSVI